MPTARVGALDVHHEVRGEGPRLLFVGGTGGDLRSRPNVLDSPLAASFELLAYDQRGLGQTSKPDVACTMADYADDAAGLLDAMGWDRCSVVGVSFGGMVAQELALRHGERVDRLVLCCTSPGGAGGSSFPLHELEVLATRERAARALGLSDTRRGAGWQAAHAEEAEALVDLMAARWQAVDDDPELAAGSRRQLEARAGHDTWDRLAALDLPVLVCGGRTDGIAPPENQVALHERIPGARLEWFDGGHLFLLEDRRAFPTIAGFLTEPGATQK